MTDDNRHQERRFGRDVKEGIASTSGVAKRYSIPEKGALTIALLRPGYAQQEVHWVGNNRKRTPYRCSGEGCVLCERAAKDSSVITIRRHIFQIWAAAQDADGNYTPGILPLPPSAMLSICDIAEEEGGAEKLPGCELTLKREYFAKGRWTALVSLSGSADLDPQDIAEMGKEGPSDREMEDTLGIPQPTENVVAWARNLAAGKSGNSGGSRA